MANNCNCFNISSARMSQGPRQSDQQRLYKIYAPAMNTIWGNHVSSTSGVWKLYRHFSDFARQTCSHSV